MATAVGHGTGHGFGGEVTWGTAVARTNWVLVRSGGSLRKTLDRPSVENLGIPAAGATLPEKQYTRSEKVGGSETYNMAYDNSTVLLLAMLLGKNTTAGAGPYTHTLDLAIPLDASVHAGLTLEKLLGNSGEAEVFEGIVPVKGEITIETGQIATLKVDYVGETSGGKVSSGTYVASSGTDCVLHTHIGATGVTWNSNDITTIRKIVITIDRGLDTDRMHLGAATIKEPPIGAQGSVTIQLDYEFAASDPLEAARDADTADQDVTFTMTGAVAGNSMAFTVHNVRWNQVDQDIPGHGTIRQTAVGTALSDGTNMGISIVCSNNNSAYDDA